MKKITLTARWLLVCMIALTGQLLQAQVANYVFSTSTGAALNPMTGSTQLLASSNDDTPTAASTGIGFPFTYNGVVYNDYSPSPDGWILMGTTAAANQFTNAITSTTNVPKIFPFWDDLATGTTGNVTTVLTGTAPNRIRIIDWFVTVPRATGGVPTTHFQCWLYETTNVIEFRYGTVTPATTTQSASVGINGPATSFHSVTISTNISSTTTANDANTGYPTAGTSYMFTPPPPPPAPTSLTFTAVGVAGMTVNWVDNSTNESAFQVWRSTDGITYTLISTVNSTTSAATGGAYTLVQTGLSSSTLYYYQVIAINPTPSTPVSGSQMTLAGTLCGTSSVGPTGTYPTITAAVAAAAANGASCPLIWELQAAYLSTAEPAFPIVVPAMGLTSTNTITLRPELGATNLSVTSAGSQTFRFDGASYFTIDGRPGGVGTTSQLTIENTALAGMAVQYQLDSRNNAIRYCSVKGANNTTTGGVIVFGNALSGGMGNSNNTIANCNVFDSATLPNNLISSENTTGGVFNSGNTVTNCNLYNFFSAAAISCGIKLAAGNSAWTITNNSIYQTGSRTYTTGAIHNGINFTAATGTGYTVTGNFIGGTAPSCGSTAMTMGGTIATRFFGISCAVGTGGVTSVFNNNTISNIALTTSSGATGGVIVGFNITGTGANVTFNGNTVGSTSATGALTATATTTAATIIGISTSASGNVAITNNNIGGFTCLGSAGTIATNNTGIISTGGNNTITGNVVGSTTVANSMANAASTGTGVGSVVGISVSSALANTISNNTVQNLTNSNGGTGASLTRGIVATSGINTIQNNIVRNLSTACPQTGTGTSASLMGIVNSATTAGGAQIVSGNTVESLVSTTTTGAVTLSGMTISPSTTVVHQIYGNKVTGVGASANTGAAIINGITVLGGTSNFYNNMVVLGVDALGGSLTPSHEYNGIFKVATNNNNFYFNSVYIGGTGVTAGTPNTYAFRRTGTAVDECKNNIFVNVRSNAGGTATHNTMGLNATTTFTTDNNNLWGNGTGYQTGIIGTTAYLALSDWKTGTTQEASSLFANPNFVSSTNLHINNALTSSIESKGVAAASIVTDIDGQTRPGPTAVNGGGTAPDMGADEFDGIPVTLDMGAFAFASPLNTGCKTATESVIVTIKNFSNQPINFAVNPVTVSCSVTGPNPATFTNVVLNTGTLAAGATQAVTMSSTYDMTAAGTFAFSASAIVVGDGASSNDATTFNFTNAAGTATGPTLSICAFSSTTLNLTGQTVGGTIQWQESPDGTTGWVNTSGATTASVNVVPTDTTYYRALICGSFASNVIVVNAQVVNAPSASGVTRCGPGSVTLTATGTSGVRWYDAPTGGNQLATTASYTTTVSNSTNFYVVNSSGTPPSSHLTTLAAGNGSNGNMFGITALNTVTITGFEGHTSSTTAATWEIYYRPNDYTLVAGANTSNVGWISLGTATNVPSLGTGFSTPIPITFNVTIPAGQTYSFHVVTTAGAGVNYTNGTTVGSVFNANADFEFRQGHGGTLFGCTNSPRVFNGRILYSAGCESNRVMVPVTVTAPPAITLAASSNAVCSGGSTTLSVTSANPDYTFSWDPSATLSAATGASVTATPTVATTYSVTASDANTGCQINASTTVAVNPLPNVTVTPSATDVCAGSTVTLTGLATNNAQIGTGTLVNTTTTYPAPYGNWYWGAKHQFLVRASELQAAGIGAGNISGLSFNVVTASGTTLTGFEIQMAHTTQTALSAFQTTGFTVVRPATNYLATVGVNTHSFTTPFIWDGVSNVIVQTCFNNANFTTNDVVSQTATSYASSAWLNQDAAGVCPNTTVNATANQRPNMTFIVTPSYTYSWTPAAAVNTPTATTTTATVNSTTTYTLAVTNSATGCSASASTTVNVFPTPTVTGTVAACQGAAVSLAATAGPSAVEWYTVPTGGTPVATGLTYNTTLAATTTFYAQYSVAVGCPRAAYTVYIAPAPAITVDATTPTGCASVSTGTANISVSGGVAPYTYSWPTGATTEDVTGLSAGNNLVLVSGSNGCVATATANIGLVTPALTIGLDGFTDALCFGQASGTVTVTPIGGVAPYSFVWSNGATTEDLLGVVAGNYKPTITDAAGCVFTTISAVPISEPTALAVSTSLSHVTCNAAANGSVTTTVTEGTAPYTYVWDNGATTAGISGLSGGMYHATITDANGCTEMAMETVNEPMPFAVAGPTLMNVSCNGAANGSISLGVGGATAPYTYAWSNGATADTVTGLVPGSYTCDVTDANGCTLTLGPIDITEPAVLAVAVDGVTNVTGCHGDETGAINITVSGGTTGYSYIWSNAETTEDLANLGAGSYSGTITDANGCTFAAGPLDITEPTELAVTAVALENATCNGLTDGSVDITVSGGTGAYTYSWSNGASTQDLAMVGAGTYSGTITDANGCSLAAGPVDITQPVALGLGGVPTITGASCAGDCNGSITNLVIVGGTSPFSYLWSNGATTGEVFGLCAGSYTGTITDANGCVYSPPFPAVVVAPTALSVSMSVVDATTPGGNNGSVSATVSGGTAPYTYQWSVAGAGSSINGLTAGAYSVAVTDANGCLITAGATVGDPTGTVDIADLGKLEIAPNPTSDFCNISIELNNASDVILDIYAANGQSVKRYINSNVTSAQYSIDMSNFASGVYMAKFVIGNQVITKQIIVSK